MKNDSEFAIIYWYHLIKTSIWLIFPSLDQTSLQDVICSVEDSDHQEPPASAPEVLPAAEDQQMKDQPQDQDSPVSPSADESAPHLLRQLDCDEIVRVEGEFTVIIQNITHTHAILTMYYFRCMCIK